jgi:hydroxyacylglutathione hydrolase
MKDLETMTIGEFTICCMETPGHTSDHVTFIITHVAPNSTKIPFVFCADTLFTGGCGRAFHDSEELFYSINKLMQLPGESLLFSGHEYTLNNLKFAKHVEPENKFIDQKIEIC